MKKIVNHKLFLLIGLLISLVSCVDPYQLQTTNFEEVIVIEATLSNELKKQEVKISKTYRSGEDNEDALITDAEVYVSDSDGNQYDFEYQTNKYISTIDFQAIANKEYELHVTTSDGKSYTSSKQKLTTQTEIESVTASVITNDKGQRGVEIAVNSFDPTNSSKYYRYEYEETSKATTPEWKADYAVVNPDNNGSVGHDYIQLFPRVTDVKVCYLTEKSKNLYLTSTNELIEDRVINFPLRFIPDTDYTIAERYSINVTQYVQNLEAYTYYTTLQELSASGGDILSPNQPGFLLGNIKSDNNPNDKAIGFFEVASVSSKRIFFNYEDLFPGESLPPYFVDCTIQEFNYCFDSPGCDGDRLNNYVIENQFTYIEHIFGAIGSASVYKYVLSPCGDCTTFSSNLRPGFWID
jgi:hypothetical protein